MDMFELSLLAQAQPGGGSLLGALLPMLLIFVGFWFLLVMPQRRKQKEHQKMLEALKAGEKVVTIGGIYGTITAVKPDRFRLQISENTHIEVTKSAVQTKDVPAPTKA